MVQPCSCGAPNTTDFRVAAQSSPTKCEGNFCDNTRGLDITIAVVVMADCDQDIETPLVKVALRFDVSYKLIQYSHDTFLILLLP